jgi:serine-type D-Ala-D-Ala carboxypeptidase/endopeptidase (penicillin-binding protein 4)
MQVDVRLSAMRARNRSAVVGGMVLVCACAIGLVAGPRARAQDAVRERASRVDQLLARPALRGASIGLSVIDLESGATLLERGGERGLVPASNQKLLVASTALALWGPQHRFETVVYTTGSIDAEGVLDGTLWIQGSGDPSLVTESFWRLVEEIRLRGIRSIRGGIGIDPGRFDGQQLHPDWEPSSRRAYYPRISGFVANFSAFRIEVRGGRAAQTPVVVSVLPEIPYFRVRSDAVTIPGAGQVSLDVSALPDGSGERIRVSGAQRVNQDASTYWRSVALPERYAADVLRMQLAAQGVKVDGSVRIAPLPDGAEPLLTFEGEPLGLIVRDLNKYSNNFIAEQLTKALGAEFRGRPGTWTSGIAVIREYLDGKGLLGPETVIADGSGLSPRNRVSAATLASVVRHAALEFGSGAEFLASLPIGGRDGTLEERGYETVVGVRGKTGHLRSVASLAGVFPGEQGKLRAFAIIVNGARGGRLDVDAAIDELVTSLAAPKALESTGD